MHAYQPLWPDDRHDWEPPSPADFTFNDALDVGAFAAFDPLVTWRTWPEVWHLDGRGRWRCCSKGSSLDSVRRFAERPSEMLGCRAVFTGQRCPDNWVIIEPRHPWSDDRYEVNEGDAAAFLSLRSSLASLGVNLLDALVFHQEHRWWSLHELTTGTTAWTFCSDRPAARSTRRGRRA